MERKQFTFYISYFRAISRIPDKAVRAEAYDAVCRYVLLEEEPDPAEMDDIVAMIFDLIQPSLETARKKAVSVTASNTTRGIPSSKKKDTTRGIPLSDKKEKEEENEREIEKKKENEIENESYPPIAPRGQRMGSQIFGRNILRKWENRLLRRHSAG